MPGETFKRELQHDLRRARRPAALTLGYFESLQKTAYIDEQARKFRTDRVKRVMHALPSGNDRIRQKSRLLSS